MSQSVTLSVVNSGSRKEYRKGNLVAVMPTGTKSISITLPDDSDFITYLGANSDLSYTITYGQNDLKTVTVVPEDTTLDQLDGTVVVDSAVPVQLTLPLSSTLFSGDATGGVGNIIRIIQTSGQVAVKPSGTEKVDGVSVPAAAAGYLTGGSSATSVAGTWAAVTDGEFAITIDGVAYDITGIDFSAAHADGAVADMDDVADRIQTYIRAGTGNEETVVWSTDHFVITSTVARVSGYVSVTSAVSGGSGTDISGVGTAFMDSETGRGTATAGAGGYKFAAAGSIHLQGLYGAYRTVGGTTAFS